jgi:hypothetical protein
MNTRFATSLSIAAVGAFTVVASQVFASGTSAWIAFGIGVASLLAAGASAPLGRHLLEHALDGATVLVAAWTIIASLVFSGDVSLWLTFAEGAALAGLALVSHVLNQVRLAGALRQLPGRVPATAEPTEQRPVGIAA